MESKGVCVANGTFNDNTAGPQLAMLLRVDDHLPSDAGPH